TSATSATLLVDVAGSAALTARNLTVTNTPAGGAATQNGVFTVGNAQATVASASPATGYQGQTLDVTVTGTNFAGELGASDVSFGAGITVNSLSSITATTFVANITITGGASTGARDVIVTNS